MVVSAIISVAFVYTGALNYLMGGNHSAEKCLILKCWHGNIYYQPTNNYYKYYSILYVQQHLLSCYLI
jgi:hypothetical protein